MVAVTRSIIGRFAVPGILLWALSLPSSAVDKSDWFQSLKQPRSGKSCCDIADCKRTRAEWREGTWFAEILGKWREVPHDTIVQKPPSLDGDAYVCTGYSLTMTLSRQYEAPYIYCFVPPNFGY
jgi:hypothetical protein